MSKSGVWISASDALDLVETRLGTRALAKDALAEMLRDERVRARAAEAWACDTSDINAIWEGQSQNSVDHDPFEEIQSDFRQSVQWADDVDSWRWPDSFFMITVSRRPKECLFYRDVTLFRNDVISIGERENATVAIAKGGRRPDLERWEWFWMEVVQLARDGRLVFGGVTSQEALSRELLLMMQARYPNDKPLELDSIKPRVRRVWQRFCEP